MSKIINTLETAVSYTHARGCLCKIIISAIFAIATTIPTYADNEPENITDSNKDCTSDTLTVSSGTAELEADWLANTVNITWYDGITALSNTGNAATCVYDGTLNLPTVTPKPGYTFAGWKVKFNLSMLDASINGTAYYARYRDAGNEDVCLAYGDGTVNDGGAETCTTESGMSDVGVNEWKTKFSYGTVYGEASCNTTNNAAAAYVGKNLETLLAGEMTPEAFLAGFSQVATQTQVAAVADALQQYQAGTMSYAEAGEVIMSVYRTNATYNKNSQGQYCWCKVTGYAPLNVNKQNVTTSFWTFLDYDDGVGPVSADACNGICAWYCSMGVRTSSEYRVAVFGGAQ